MTPRRSISIGTIQPDTSNFFETRTTRSGRASTSWTCAPPVAKRSLTVSDLFATGGAHVQEVLALPERVVRVSKKFDVSGWIVPMLIERRGVIYLDATWISAVTGTALFSRRAPLLPPAAAEEQRFPWEPASED